jgi:hypothetical protein
MSWLDDVPSLVSGLALVMVSAILAEAITGEGESEDQRRERRKVWGLAQMVFVATWMVFAAWRLVQGRWMSLGWWVVILVMLGIIAWEVAVLRGMADWQ